MEENKFKWFNEESEAFMRNNEAYLKNDETIQDRVESIAKRAFVDIYPNPDYYDKFIDYMSRGFISLSTPVWSNFGREGTLAIACFNSHVPDTMDGILYTGAEAGMMSKYGGGTSAYVGEIRPRGSVISKGGIADGPVHFAKLFETVVDVARQGKNRRGSMTITLPVEHPDIKEFLDIRHEGSPIQDLFPSVSITNQWMQEMIDGDAEKRNLWADIIRSRQRVGTPFVFFKDNANDVKQDIYKHLDKDINSSNLCQEIMLSSTEDESFVCCLSSLNVEKYDEWKDTDVVEVMTAFLDTVITDFVETASKIPFLERAVKFSKNQRALGLGVLGFASYLQKMNIPFESMEAKLANVEIFSTMQKRSYAESERLGKLLGYAPIYDAEGYEGVKRRNVTTMAIAPTSSSSFILSQTSQGIEPYRSNYYMRNMAKGKIPFKNPHLEKLLKEKGRDTEEVWDNIGMNFGSVQHLDFLSDHEKEVFKTFGEISQIEIVNLAAQRQRYIDQGQSLNFLLHPKTPPKELNELMIHAWKTGIKSLYYHHSISSIQEYTNTISCKSCES